jgi:hypothetical protein
MEPEKITCHYLLLACRISPTHQLYVHFSSSFHTASLSALLVLVLENLSAFIKGELIKSRAILSKDLPNLCFLPLTHIFRRARLCSDWVLQRLRCWQIGWRRSRRSNCWRHGSLLQVSPLDAKSKAVQVSHFSLARNIAHKSHTHIITQTLYVHIYIYIYIT